MSSVFKKSQWLILLAIFVVSINLRPAISSIGPMLDIIRKDLQLTNTEVSFLTVIPVICMGLFAMLAPYFNRKFGLQKTMLGMLGLIAISTAVRALPSNFALLVMTSFFIGVAIAVIGPLLSALIKQQFPERAASVIGVYSFGMGMGSSLGAGLTAVFYKTSESYPFALAIWGILAVLGMLAWRAAMRQPLEVKQQVVKKTTMQASNPWKTAKAWGFLLFFGFQSALFFSVITWFVPLATDAGISLLQAGSLLSALTVIQMVLNLGFPLLLEKFPSRTLWLLVTLCVGMGSVGLMWSGDTQLFTVGALLMGIPLGVLFPIALLLPLDETDTAEETNAWTAMMQTGGFVIGGLLPLVIAMTYDYTGTHKATLAIMLLLLVLMAILAIWMGASKKEPV